MLFLVAFLSSLFWFLFLALLLYSKSSPEAQVRRRIMIMISQAENLRLQSIPSSSSSSSSLDPRFSFHLSFFQRIVLPFINFLSDHLQSFAPVQIKKIFDKLIFLSGKQGVWNTKFLVLFWISSIAFSIFFALFLSRHFNFHFLQDFMFIIIFSLLGAFFPFFCLLNFIRKRKRLIRRQLPEFLDLLCVSVQAGLSFDASVSKIVSRMHGVLISEFERFLNDISLGMTRSYALSQLAKRCDLEEVFLFTSSVIQAERLGTSMARTLKLQSDNIRERHRQFVKSQALKAPVKIIFPMVLFIFPSIFVVLLLPSIITIIHTLSNP